MLEQLPWYGWVFLTLALSSTANEIFASAYLVSKGPMPGNTGVSFFVSAILWVLFLWAGTP
jgi:hypothetical protein